MAIKDTYMAANNAKNANNYDVGEAWPIIPLDGANKDLPPFPLDALPPLVREYVIGAAEQTQTNPDMAAVIALGVLAICTQGRYVMEVRKRYREPLNLYVAVFADPGERKSAIISMMTDYIYRYSIEHDVCLTADDCTPEALAKVLANNNGVMSLVSAEGGIMDQMAGRYSKGPNIDVYLKAHCGEPIVVERIGRSADRISCPTLSIVMATQPEVLSTIMANRTFAGRGLLARFLYAVPSSRLGTRKFDAPVMEDSIVQDYERLLDHLLSQGVADDRLVLTLSPEATDLVREHFEEHERYLASGACGIMDWAAKYIGAVCRIAGLLHLADGHDHLTPIAGETVGAAIEIGRYLLAQAERAYGQIGETPVKNKARIMLAKIRKNGFQSGKRSDLYPICRSMYPNAEGMMPTLELLEDYGYLHLEQLPYCGRGRKPEAYIVVNPAIIDEYK